MRDIIQLSTGDEAWPNEAYARGRGTTTRTLSKYEKLPDGLPYLTIAGKKYRPLRQCDEWLLRRITYPNQTSTKRRRGAS